MSRRWDRANFFEFPLIRKYPNSLRDVPFRRVRAIAAAIPLLRPIPVISACTHATLPGPFRMRRCHRE
jgi:hypothetical protein